LLVGCGGGNRQTSSPLGDAQLQGNWTATATSAVFTDEHLQVDLFIKQTGKTISANNLLFGGSSGGLCANTGTMTGTVGGDTVTMTIHYEGSSDTATVTGTLASSGVLTGVYTTTGSCTNGDRGNLSAQWVPAVTSSSWSGTAVSGSVSTNFTANLNEDNNGKVLGTIAFSDSPCLSTVTLTDGLHVGSLMAVTDGVNLGAAGIVNTSAKHVDGSYQSGSACGNEMGDFTMSRP